jgi:hypothetical protein
LHNHYQPAILNSASEFLHHYLDRRKSFHSVYFLSLGYLEIQQTQHWLQGECREKMIQ